VLEGEACFPSFFKFGAASSGFQFEMGDPEGRAIDSGSDWWAWAHDPLNAAAGVVSGDLPEDGPCYWLLYRRDHELLCEMGLEAYRMGVEWSRIFPKPTFKVHVDVKLDGGVRAVHIDKGALEELDKLADKAAVEHYREAILDLKARGVHVTVCLNHFTMPAWLHSPLRARSTALREGGGWVSRQAVIEFTKYAAYMAYKLGDLVDAWATLNEPRAVAYEGYLRPRSGFPPGVLSLSAYTQAMRHLVEAHARAYDALKEWSPREVPAGVIYDIYLAEPLREEDAEAAENARYVLNWWYLDAIAKGLLAPEYTSEARSSPVHRSDLKGRVDWIGVNYYTRLIVKRGRLWSKSMDLLNWVPVRGYGFECRPNSTSLAGLPTSDAGQEMYPQGIREALKETYRRYKLPLVVSENGVADHADKLRPHYILSHLAEVYKAIEDGVDVRGYYYWALVDNYEWAHGFRMRYGLCHVDFRTKHRLLRPSAIMYARIAAEKSIPGSITPPSLLEHCS